MSHLVETAIDRLRQMPVDRQDMIARLVLHEIEEDERWMQSTNSNVQKLQSFVDQVLAADDRGEYEVLDPDQL